MVEWPSANQVVSSHTVGPSFATTRVAIWQDPWAEFAVSTLTWRYEAVLKSMLDDNQNGLGK
jgi:hypothetical protein